MDDAGDRLDVVRGVPADRVRWGPILAGTFTALTALAILSTLGAAIGLSSYDRGHDDARNFAMAGGAWGILSTIIAFALGGWVTARSMAVRGRDNGFLNGALVAAVGLPLMLLLVGSAATAMSSAELANDRDVAAVTNSDASRTVDTEQVRRTGSRTAWGALAGMVLAVAASGVAGHLAARRDDDDADFDLVNREKTRTPTESSRAVTA